MDDAIAFTQAHSSQHSDGIITNNTETAERYLSSIDSAAFYNASTRFTDGGQFGLGEVGINTNRLHARGPWAVMNSAPTNCGPRGKPAVNRFALQREYARALLAIIAADEGAKGPL